MATGLRISWNNQDITQVRKEFDELVRELQKKADKPIDFKVNSIGIQDELKKSAKSVDELIKAYSKLGEVKVKPLSYDADGNLQKFQLSIQQTNGVLDKLIYKVKEFQDTGKGKLTSVGFNLEGIKELDNSEKILKEILKTDEKIRQKELEVQKQREQYNKEFEKLYQDTYNQAEKSIRNQINIEKQLINAKELEAQKLRENLKLEEENFKQLKLQLDLADRIKLSKTKENMNNTKVKPLVNKKLDKQLENETTLNKNGDALARRLIYQEEQERLKVTTDVQKNIEKTILNSNETITQQQNRINKNNANEYEQLWKKLLLDRENKENEFINKQKEYDAKLGQNVKTKTPFNFNADANTLNKYVKEVIGVNAEWSKAIPKQDQFGRNIKEISARVKEGTDKWHNYKLIMNETDGSIKKVDMGLSNMSKTTLTLGEKFKNLISGITLWAGGMTLFYGSIRQLEKAIESVNSIQKSQTNIMMIADDEVNKYSGGIEGLTNHYSNLAGKLHTTNKDLLDGAEEYLRAGRSIKETDELLKATTIGGKISGQSSKEVAEQLIAIGNGLDISSNKMMTVVDKISHVDNTSATSFKELATAMQYTSASAKNVNISFDQLLSYVGTVSSVSRRSAETIGQAFN